MKDALSLKPEGKRPLDRLRKIDGRGQPDIPDIWNKNLTWSKK